MTNLKKVNTGHNIYCGPAVLSALTGLDTDRCAYEFTKITGKQNIKTVTIPDLLKAVNNLGFMHKQYPEQRSLYATIISLVNDDGLYVVGVPEHVVVIEVSKKEVWFCDNHTKEPIAAAGSARLGQAVTHVFKVWRKPEFPTEVTEEVIRTELVRLHKNDIIKLLGLHKVQSVIMKTSLIDGSTEIDDIELVVTTKSFK
jgi:hypothetical protein